MRPMTIVIGEHIQEHNGFEPFLVSVPLMDFLSLEHTKVIRL